MEHMQAEGISLNQHHVRHSLWAEGPVSVLLYSMFHVINGSTPMSLDLRGALVYYL